MLTVMKLPPFLLLTAFCITHSLCADKENYTIDPTHSSVAFSIRHFVAKTTGNFNQFEGSIFVDTDDMTKNRVEASIRVASIDTADAKRDAHLNADDYFNSAEHPGILFKSQKWETTDQKDTFMVTGDLTMLGHSRTVQLKVVVLGFGPGRNGAYLSGWEATARINRSEWGLTAGTPAIGDEVDITINIEAIRQ